MNEILEFIKQNWFILLLIFILFLVVLHGVKNTICSIFKGVTWYNKLLLTLSFLGFIGQIILFKKKYFEFGLNLTIFVSIIFFLLFINREKIKNEDFNACVITFLVGESAYCMIVSNQKELYDYEIFHSIIYAGIYIGIPMFVAYKFTSKEKEVSNKEDIYKKLEEIENKLKDIDSSINKSYKFGCSMLSIFKRFK